MKLLNRQKGSRFGLCILIIMYAAAIPFYTALYQAFKLLNYIDKNQAFSQISVKALMNIKRCAITIQINIRFIAKYKNTNRTIPPVGVFSNS